MQPRIFGPYEPIRRDYPIREYLDDIAGSGVVQSVYVQTNWAKADFEREAEWVQRTHDETGWPHAIVAYADMSADDARPQFDRLARYPLVRGVRMQLHWHENAMYRFAARADLCDDPVIQRNVARLADYGWSFDLQVFAPQMAGAARLAAACPKVTFVLQHAGMREDASAEGRALGATGMAAARRATERRLEAVGPRHLHPSQRREPYRRHCRATLSRLFGADRCLFGSNFPIEKLWTDLSRAGRSLSQGRGAALRQANARRSSPATARRVYRLVTTIAWTESERGGDMALEIKILDYGDIELESSFLVLGTRLRPHAARADARLSHHRRPLSGRRRHRLPLQSDHGDARHAGPAVP